MRYKKRHASIPMNLGAHECTECHSYEHELLVEVDEYRVLEKYGYLDNHYPTCLECGGELKTTERRDKSDELYDYCELETCNGKWAKASYTTRCPICFPIRATGDGTLSTVAGSLKGRSAALRDSLKAEIEATKHKTGSEDHKRYTQEAKKLRQRHADRKLTATEKEDLHNMKRDGVDVKR